MEIPQPPPELVAWLNAISPFATAVVTVALVWFTAILARETRRMARAGAQPQVVVTLEPNDWAINHLDMRISNTGNATAFDIEIKFDPPFSGDEISRGRPLPFQHMSALRPGQLLSSHVASHKSLEDRSFTITVSWSRKPKGRRERLNYEFNLADYTGYARLGGGDPAVQISQTLKNFRDDWRYVASGSRRVAVDSHDRIDRENERKEREEWLEQWENDEAKGGDEKSPPNKNAKD